jgi:hypothetical protein
VTVARGTAQLPLGKNPFADQLNNNNNNKNNNNL